MLTGISFLNETIQANARAVNAGGISESLDEANALYSRLSGASFKLVPSSFGRGVLYSGTPGANGDLTWTRGSDAFRTNASGVLQRVPWNLLSYSNTPTDSSWSKLGLGAGTAPVVTANAGTSPDGTTNASRVQFNCGGTTSSDRSILQKPSIALINGASYAGSIYVKAYSSGEIGKQLRFIVEGVTSQSIITLTDSWQRVAITGTSSTTSSNYIIETRGGTTTNTTADVLIFGAQLVEGTTAQTYLPTTDRLNFPRLSYMYGSCPSALLEPQRTNVVLYSSDLSQSVWSKTNYTLSSATAIQGLTATRITKNATNNGAWNGTGARDVINTVGTFASGTKAFSVLLRKGNTAKVGLLINGILVGASVAVSCEFDFSTETFTNVSSGLTATFEKPTTDVYRLILVCNDTGTGTSKQLWIAPIDSSNNTVTDGYVDVAYFQWELGAYPTTYIPTTSATATRVADSFSRSNIYTNGLISASGGTWFVELRGNVSYTRDAFTNTPLIIGDNATSPNNGLMLRNSGGSSMRLEIRKLIAGTTTLLYTTLTDTIKIAFKWNGSSVDVFVNGTKQVSASFFSTTNMDFLVASGVDVPKFIQQMALFPTPLSDTDCTAITSL